MLFDLVEHILANYFSLLALLFLLIVPFLVGWGLDTWFYDGATGLITFSDYAFYWMSHSFAGALILLTVGVIACLIIGGF